MRINFHNLEIERLNKVEIQSADNCKATLLDDCWKECSRCQQPFLEKYWDEELDWYIELNLSTECTNCQKQNTK